MAELPPGRRTCAACVEKGKAYRLGVRYQAEVWP